MRRKSLRPGLVLLISAVCVALAWWRMDSRVASLVANTAWLVAGVGALALPVGILLAVLVAKTNVPGRTAAALLLVMLLFVPLYVVAGAWDAGFGIQGWHTLSTNPHLAREPWLSGWRGAIWVHAMAAAPWVALIVAAGLRSVEAELEEHAVLEMPAPRVLWRVTMRRSAAAIVLAAVWVAMATSSEIAATDLFQVRTFAEEVYTEAALGAFDFATEAGERGTPGVRGGRESAASTSFAESQDVPPGESGVPSLWYGVALSALLVLAALAAGRRYFDDLPHAPERAPWIWRLGAARWPAAILLWFLMLIIAGVPFANLMFKAGVRVTSTDAGRVRDWSAGRVVERVAAAPGEFRSELWQSAKIGAAATTAAVVIATFLGWSMRGSQGFPAVRLGVLAFLMAAPGPLIGIALIRLLNRPVDSPLAGLARLYDTIFTAGVAQTLRALPLITLVLWPALASVPQAMLDVAATDGASWFRRLVSIALPQRLPALVVAWLVGMAVAMGELAATVLVIPPGPTTISVRIFSLIHYGVDDRVAAICLALALGLAAMVASGAAFARMKAR